MIVSRMVPLAGRSLGAVRTAIGRTGRSTQQRFISTSKPRLGGDWYYRSLPPPQPKFELLAEASGAFMWWWIFWHCMTDYHHIIGHFDFPDIDGWTDEELGVPPDDADDPE